MKSITRFDKEFEFLSNFYSATFIWDSYSWPTVEHAFQATKATSDRDFLKVYKAEKPNDARRIGRSITLRKDWENIKIGIMTKLVWCKFGQNPKLRKKLLNTGSAELIEGNWWHDNFFGDCFCKACCDIEGKNILGYILTTIRQAYSDIKLNELQIECQHELMYGIGQDHGGGSYGMWDGPNPLLAEMLIVDGRDDDSVIIRFNEDGSDEVLYRWLIDKESRVYDWCKMD